MTTLNTGGRRRGAAAFANHQIEAERGISRKELATCARDAEKALNLRLSERLVLRELAGSFGEVPIEDRLLVWPSNEYLAARTGLSERAIRYALKSLAAQNLIVFKDSANGKRYARRDLAGTIVSAYGFDLMPLYARQGRMGRPACQSRSACVWLRTQAYDEITVCRRAVEELIDALATHYPQVDYTEIEEMLAARPPGGAKTRSDAETRRRPSSASGSFGTTPRRSFMKPPMRATIAPIKKQTTIPLPRLVKRASERKLSPIVLPNSGRASYHRH